VTEQVPPGTPDLAPENGTSSGERARAQQAQHAPRQHAQRAAESADVIVVGAGPAGSSVGYHLASAGLDVLVLEKTHFPREKVCGDGLTPLAPASRPADHRRRRPDRAGLA
jgi:hypothetical protein